MKTSTRTFNTTETQTVADAIAFSEYLTECNPNYNQLLPNFLRTLPPEMLLESDEFDRLWFDHLEKTPLEQLKA